MTHTRGDALESAVRAAMAAEYYEPHARVRHESKWPMALPLLAGIVAALALVLLR